jgi:hypothetical protein
MLSFNFFGNFFKGKFIQKWHFFHIQGNLSFQISIKLLGTFNIIKLNNFHSKNSEL